MFLDIHISTHKRYSTVSVLMLVLFHYTTFPGKHPHKFHILLHTSKTKDLKLPLSVTVKRPTLALLKLGLLLCTWFRSFLTGGPQIFQKSRSDLKILHARRATQGKFHIMDTTNLKGHHTQFSNPHDLVPGVCPLFLTFWRRNYFFNFSTLCIQNVNKTGTK